MDLNSWMRAYRGIAKRLSIDQVKDEAATVLLSSLLAERETLLPEELRRRFLGRPVAVFGAGPSLEGDLGRCLGSGILDSVLSLAADGATSAMVKAGRLPDVIFTDLDGNLGDQLDASKRGCWAVIHAHGDNMPAVREALPMFSGPLIGSTQVIPMPPKVLNLGGFTDGDRAAYWARELGASLIFLLGMDFGDSVGEHSKPRLSGERLSRKLAKLEIGRELISSLARDAKAYNLTGSLSTIPGVRNISLEEAALLIKKQHC